MELLPSIYSPADLQKLDSKQLRQLADEIREFLITNVTQTGGHLGPNLGAVEITLAVHRIFDSPRDKIIFDTGHQSYVHKIITGRHDFSTLRQENGLSGYPDRSESEHDILESSHASSSLSWADGLSRAFDMQAAAAARETGKEPHRPYIVAVVGDGALTGGMAWEALNNIAARKDGKIVIIVNDNGRSYAPTIGGMANYLASLRSTLDRVRTHHKYELMLNQLKNRLHNQGRLRDFIYRSLRAAKKGVKDWWMPQGMFEDLGLKYVGPVDGHDQKTLEEALNQAKNFGGPVIVHTLTEKGHGYAPARAHKADQFHAVGIIDPITGEAKEKSGGVSTWTSVFGDEITKIAAERKDIVGITAAMLEPVGLKEFAARYPERVIDVGIAEQHAVASAAAMAYAGIHPVVALYSTFLNRAFDQLLMDVALHKAGITIVLDRAGVTGPDGPSHHGQWDLSLMQIIPGVRVAAPRDGAQLREQLREAVVVDDAPTVIRYPKGNIGANIDAIRQRLADGVDILAHTLPEKTTRDVLLVAVGAMATLSLEVAEQLAARNISAQVVDPRWIFPVPGSLLSLAENHRLVVVAEDAISIGGVGSSLRHEMRQAGVDTAVHEVGLPVEFLDHGSRSQVLARVGMTTENITEGIVAQVHGLKLPHAKPLPEKPQPTAALQANPMLPSAAGACSKKQYPRTTVKHEALRRKSDNEHNSRQ